MILFASDFGHDGPYVGQVHAVLATQAPGVAVIDLMHDLPAFRPAAAGYLLRAVLRTTAHPGPGETEVVLAVVDPGVGTEREPIIVEADGRLLVGPDNGLLAAAGGGAADRAWRIDWRPDALSDSFHGRDLFAPVAALLSQGLRFERSEIATSDLVGADLPNPWAEIIYCDRYGNAMTGLDAADLSDGTVLTVGGEAVRNARTFGAVPEGTGFWYANSLGLAEIAINQGDAAATYGLSVGTPVTVG